MRIKFRKLKANEIECRLGGKINENQNYYLLYQNSRTTMEILDEYFGNFGWGIDYKEVNGQTYGLLSVYDVENKQWVIKSDTGDESNISEKKGQSSDILKRCAVRLGIGRELYTAPRIVLPNTIKGEVKIKNIHYDDEKIILLELENNKKIIYHWDVENGATLYIKNDGYTNTTNYTNNANIEQKPLSVEQIREMGKEYMKNISENEKETFTGFMKYYIKRVESNNFKGNFNIETLWQKWINSEYRKAS